MVTKFEFNGDKFSLVEEWIFMVTFCDIFGDSNDLTQHYNLQYKISGSGFYLPSIELCRMSHRNVHSPHSYLAEDSWQMFILREAKAVCSYYA